MKGKRWKDFLSKEIVVKIGFLTILVVSIATFFKILSIDAGNYSDGAGPNLKFDWVTAGCTMFSALSSAFLGVVAILQNHAANKTNERLAEINDRQLENAIISQNYPIIEFEKKQSIKLDTKEWSLKFFDTRGVALREILIEDMWLYPYKGSWKADEGNRPVCIWESDKCWKQLEFTPDNKDGARYGKSGGYYLVNLRINPEDLQQSQCYRIEFGVAIKSTTNVVSAYERYCLLMNKADVAEEEPTRRYHRIYHQFCEFGEISSEQKYREQLDHKS